RIRLGRDEGEVRGAVGRRNRGPRTAWLNACFKDKLEAKLIEVKAEAAVQIANENRDGLETQVRILSIQTNSGSVYPFARSAGHAQHYKAMRDDGQRLRWEWPLRGRRRALPLAIQNHAVKGKREPFAQRIGTGLIGA